MLLEQKSKYANDIFKFGVIFVLAISKYVV